MEEIIEKRMFTVVIPTLNEEVHLPHLLNDLDKQTYKGFESIVVDAKSIDKTREIAKKYKAKVLTSNIKNVSYQRNLGGNAANTDWIVFMDADNRIPKTYLQKVKKEITKGNPDIFSTWMKPDSYSNKHKIMATLMNIFMDMNKNSDKPYILESMVFIKKETFKKLKGFNTKIPWREGEELLERAHKMGLKFTFGKNPKYTYSFRRLKKIGAFQMLQEMSQMEIIKMLKGNLTKKETEFLYPMKGGEFYKNDKTRKMSLKRFLSVLFD